MNIGRTKPCEKKQRENQHQGSEHQLPYVEHFDKHLPRLLLQHHGLNALYQLWGESKLQEITWKVPNIQEPYGRKNNAIINSYGII